MDAVESLEREAIRKMHEFVSKPLFTEEETMNRHRLGLKTCYLEAARLEFGDETWKSSVADEDVLLNRIDELSTLESRCSGLCREVENVIAKTSSMMSLRESARAKALEVKTACDALLVSQQSLLKNAYNLENALRDLEPISNDRMEYVLRSGDEEGASALFDELDERERRLRGRDHVFQDELDFVAEIARARATWTEMVFEALKRHLNQRAKDEEALLEVASTLGKYQALLRKYDPERADEAQHLYCILRLDKSWSSTSSSLDEACKAERRLHASLFGSDDAALDAALHSACDERLHFEGRARVLHATTLEELRKLAAEATAIRDNSDIDDAVRQAAALLCFDAQERAIFVASSKLRDEVELASPTTIELQRAATSPTALYAPIRAALAILEQLHGAVQPTVFDDFAQHVVALSVSIIKNLPPLDNFDLFAIKHLLALRERVLPYGITYGQVVKRKLNWANAKSQLAAAEAAKQHRFQQQQQQEQEAKSLKWWRASALLSNALLRPDSLLPTVDESTVNARKELESELKARCASFVSTVRHRLVSHLATFLDHIQAQCPKDCDIKDAPQALLTHLRGLTAAQPSEIGRVTRAAYDAAVYGLERARADLQAFLENANTRAFLLKPAKHHAHQLLDEFRAVAALLLSPDVFPELEPLFDKYALLLDPSTD